MREKFPVAPYPSVGEIVYECAVRSGLVRSNDPERPKLYDDLKAFKDDRKRPGLRPIEFPKYVLVDLEDCLASFIGDDATAFALFYAIRQWLSWYSGIVARHDATLLEREDMAEKVLWPTAFAFGGTLFLSTLVKLCPSADPKGMLNDSAPFGRHLRLLCTRGAADFKAICEHRAQRDGIDPDNCRDTLEDWLSGRAIPNRERCLSILEALGLASGVSARTWILVARLLAKTSREHRAFILARMQPDHGLPDVETHLWQLNTSVGWEIGKRLNIGRDRPYAKLVAALYDPTVPRDPNGVEDMLRRLEHTWKPIAGRTQHLIEWLRGRFLVLSGKLDEGYAHYLAAYNLGAGRDPEVYRKVLDEALALAGKLGQTRAVGRFGDLIGLYWTTEWDYAPESLPEHFRRKFPRELCFHGALTD
jgi:hypothetical protein